MGRANSPLALANLARALSSSGVALWAAKVIETNYQLERSAHLALTPGRLLASFEHETRNRDRIT